MEETKAWERCQRTGRTFRFFCVAQAVLIIAVDAVTAMLPNQDTAVTATAARGLFVLSGALLVAVLGWLFLGVRWLLRLHRHLVEEFAGYPVTPWRAVLNTAVPLYNFFAIWTNFEAFENAVLGATPERAGAATAVTRVFRQFFALNIAAVFVSRVANDSHPALQSLSDLLSIVALLLLARVVTMTLRLLAAVRRDLRQPGPLGTLRRDMVPGNSAQV